MEEKLMKFVLCKKCCVYELNELCYLVRIYNENTGIDALYLEFNPINGVKYGKICNYRTKINARDYNSIIAEIEKIITMFFEDVTWKMMNKLKAGRKKEN